MIRVKLGESVKGRALEAFVCGQQTSASMVVFGGFHGDEPNSVTLAHRLLDLVDSAKIQREGAPWIIMPVVNPDGYERRRRCNHNGVDINRNFPTRDWQLTKRRSRMFGGQSPASEPETQTVVKLIERHRPACIITIHSIGQRRYCNNYDGPGRTLAQAMCRHNQYPVRASIGYPTPGSFGTWAGRERSIPTITLELPTHHSAKRCWEDNRSALLHIHQACGHRSDKQVPAR